MKQYLRHTTGKSQTGSAWYVSRVPFKISTATLIILGGSTSHALQERLPPGSTRTTQNQVSRSTQLHLECCGIPRREIAVCKEHELDKLPVY